MDSEEDSSDSEQRVADGASIQPYQYEPEDGDNPMTDSDPPDDDPEDYRLCIDALSANA